MEDLGIIQGDLRPSNILEKEDDDFHRPIYNNSFSVKLIDFDIAYLHNINCKRYCWNKQRGFSKGYCSPEL